MKEMTSARRTSAPFVQVVMALLLVLGAAFGWQWHRSAILRAETEAARLEVGDLELLQAENRRLKSEQIPAAELERLRADHAALPRLRAELEAARPSQQDGAAR